MEFNICSTSFLGSYDEIKLNNDNQERSKTGYYLEPKPSFHF
jgi:hypothetical protein